jgi:hypothetical protein
LARAVSRGSIVMPQSGPAIRVDVVEGCPQPIAHLIHRFNLAARNGDDVQARPCTAR